MALTLKDYKRLFFSFEHNGKEEIVPNDMNATMTLKNNDFVDRFQNCKSLTASKVDAFKEKNGYLPPYWQLVKMAEECSAN
jgi:hypothetical protein